LLRKAVFGHELGGKLGAFVAVDPPVWRDRAGTLVLNVEILVVLAIWAVLRRDGMNLLTSRPSVAAIVRPELWAKA
jgi:hypothetical protein